MLYQFFTCPRGLYAQHRNLFLTYNCTAWHFRRNPIFLCCPIGSRYLFPPLPCVDFGWTLCIHLLLTGHTKWKRIFSHWGRKKSVTSISEMLTQIYSAKDQFHSTYFTKKIQLHLEKNKASQNVGSSRNSEMPLCGTMATINHLTWKLFLLTNEACMLITNFIFWLHAKDWNNLAKEVSYTDFNGIPYIIPGISEGMISERKCKRYVFCADGERGLF